MSSRLGTGIKVNIFWNINQISQAGLFTVYSGKESEPTEATPSPPAAGISADVIWGGKSEKGWERGKCTTGKGRKKNSWGKIKVEKKN